MANQGTRPAEACSPGNLPPFQAGSNDYDEMIASDRLSGPCFRFEICDEFLQDVCRHSKFPDLVRSSLMMQDYGMVPKRPAQVILLSILEPLSGSPFPLFNEPKEFREGLYFFD
jgi:hypothetical protein